MTMVSWLVGCSISAIVFHEGTDGGNLEKWGVNPKMVVVVSPTNHGENPTKNDHFGV